jgi:hypothetical protein
VSDDRDALRAADVDRNFVAERLREALNAGRLDLTEYDERLQQAYAARTYGDLKSLLADLPAVTPPGHSQIVPTGPILPSMTPALPPPPHGVVTQWLAKEWGDWLTLSLILSAIWLVSGAGYFWPGWIIGIIGAIKLGQTINGLSTGAPRKSYERHQRKAVEREERRAEERDRRTEERGQRDTD